MTERQIQPIIELKQICKGFPGVQALERVDLAVLPGEVHGIVGENGAGKSTLMNILGGELQPDGGSIFYCGAQQQIASPYVAQQLGISVVHQELALCPNLTVAENISLTATSPRSPLSLMRRGEARTVARGALERLGMGHLDLNAPVSRLGVADQQIVEIAKAISTDVRVLILDEPNSALTLEETEHLFAVIRQLRSEGVAILYVSHRLEEVLSLCDRISVLRDGQRIETLDVANANVDRLISSMVGRSIDHLFRRSGASAVRADIALQVRQLNCLPHIQEISFDLHAGEILGVAGLPNAGKEELVDCCFGLRPYRGSVAVRGRRAALRTPHAAIEHGMALIPADRRGAGALLVMGVQENVVASNLRRVSAAGFVNKSAVRRAAADSVRELDIKTASLAQRMATLSGGNQQKVILARGLFTEASVLILHEPTRGIDVGAKSEIYAILHKLAEEGVAVLIVSSELPELIGQCDRILVLHRGRLTGEFTQEDATEERILACAMGQAEHLRPSLSTEFQTA